MTRSIATLLTLAGILTATDANAQHLFPRKHVRGAAIPASSAGTTAPAAPRLYSYSYYTRSALPVRTYVGYGDIDFPFHGAPYGHPYDPWTYATLSGSYSSSLARYYDPPVK